MCPNLTAVESFLTVFTAMIVPQYWAEARRHQARSKGRPQVTVRRFGWSDTSQADAEQMADQRAQEAFERITSGVKLLRREPKIAYNGAEGVPIREEILSRHGDVVITRNAYGAHCLNTPDVVFADIDFATKPGGLMLLFHVLALLAGGIALGMTLKFGAMAVFVAFLLALICAYPLAVLTNNLLVRLRGGPQRYARARVESFVSRHTDWHLRLYRTPAGFRVLAMHGIHDPHDPIVPEFFAALGVDPVYAKMCRNQRCFRARVSPKPWRIGIASHMRPRPGVWPVKPEHLEKRQSWISNYETVATRFASCRFIEAIGSGTVHPKADAVCTLHDRMSLALSGMEIA
jgi:hypothetical protein